jgi:hypothetical protein
MNKLIILLFIILFYYLFFNYNSNYEYYYRGGSLSSRGSSNKYCTYCYKNITHKDIHDINCPYYYQKTHNIITAKNNNKMTFGSHGGNGGQKFLFVCDKSGNSNNYINNLAIRSGSRVDGLTATCNNGVNKKVGGNGGTERKIDLNNGFNKILVRSGGEIDRLTINENNYGGNGGGGPYELSCENGKINGIYGKAGSRLDNFGIICTHT